MNMYIVGGTFDVGRGKFSHFIEVMGNYFPKAITINGGNINDLYLFRPHDIDVLIWMPNVDNAEDKILPRLKVMNPKMVLVSSKRVIEKKYSNYDLVNRLINTRSNLGIIIDKMRFNYWFSLIDPLGNIFCRSFQLKSMLPVLSQRIDELMEVKRISSQQLEFDIDPDSSPPSADFLEAVRCYGTEFSSYVQANNPDRFLGNASTRCEWGFPAERRTDHIWVSRRNVNKESVSADDFVKVYLCAGKVRYLGANKPSVDSAIQIELFERFKNINYIIHGHCYVDGAKFTESKLPCGDLNELHEINKLAPDQNSTFVVINLLGHGCLIMSKTVENLYKVKLQSRPLLED